MAYLIGLFTTAYGRIMLYQVLNQLAEGVNDLDDVKPINSDTDSCYILLKAGVPLESLGLPLGDGMGQLANVLDDYGPNCYITEFVVLGPKAYSYIIYNPDTGVSIEANKCKGIASTVTNDATLNFANMRNLVLNNDPNNRVKLPFTNNTKIKRKKFFNIVTESETKNISYTYSKRIVLNNNVTVPYGFIVYPLESEEIELIESEYVEDAVELEEEEVEIIDDEEAA